MRMGLGKNKVALGSQLGLPCGSTTPVLPIVFFCYEICNRPKMVGWKITYVSACLLQHAVERSNWHEMKYVGVCMGMKRAGSTRLLQKGKVQNKHVVWSVRLSFRPSVCLLSVFRPSTWPKRLPEIGLAQAYRCESCPSLCSPFQYFRSRLRWL